MSEQEKSTAVATRPIDRLSNYLRGEGLTRRVQETVAPFGVNERMWLSILEAYVNSNDKLLRSALEMPKEFERALLRAASNGLVVDGASSCLVVHGGRNPTIRWQAMYPGLISRGKAVGAIRRMICNLVYERDEFTPDLAHPEKTEHIPYWRGADRGEIICAYALSTLPSGDMQIELMSRHEVETYSMRRSPSYRYAESSGKKDSPWHTDFPAMMRRAPVMRAFKFIGSDPMLIRLITEEERLDAGIDEAETEARVVTTKPTSVAELVEEASGAVERDEPDDDAPLFDWPLAPDACQEVYDTRDDWLDDPIGGRSKVAGLTWRQAIYGDSDADVDPPSATGQRRKILETGVAKARESEEYGLWHLRAAVALRLISAENAASAQPFSGDASSSRPSFSTSEAASESSDSDEPFGPQK